MKHIFRRMLLLFCCCLFLVSCGSNQTEPKPESEIEMEGVFEVEERIGKTPKGTGTIIKMGNYSEELPETGTASKKEMRAIEKKMKSIIASLDASKIDTIYLQQVKFLDNDPNPYVYTYQSDSREIISKWVELFQRMDISGDPYLDICGPGYMVIAIAQGDTITKVAAINVWRIQDGMKTMCTINNLTELRPEMMEAARMVSEEIEPF